jgi:hypothetical protein
MKFLFLFLVQLEYEIEMPEIGCSSVPTNVMVSRILEVPSGRSSPDCCVGYFSRIADLEDRLSSLKQ